MEYSIRYQEIALLTPHQEYYQYNQQWTIGTNAYKQYILLLHCKLTSHIFDLKSIWLQQSFVLIKLITSHFQYVLILVLSVFEILGKDWQIVVMLEYKRCCNLIIELKRTSKQVTGNEFK